MGSLLESVKASISSELVQSMAFTASESPANVKKGVETAAATILAALASKSHDTALLNQIVSLTTTDTKAGFLHLLFGSHKAAVESKIAQSAGLSSVMGATILSSAGPLVLGTLAGHLSGGAAGLNNLLAMELPSLRNLIPDSLPGIPSSKVSPVATALHPSREKIPGGWAWPVLLLGAFVIGGLVWYIHRANDIAGPSEAAANGSPDARTTTAATVPHATRADWAPLGPLFKRPLRDGTELDIPQLGVEGRLINWIESTKRVDKTTWFGFDRLLFDAGSATLEPASREQLSNVAAILKAYPAVRIKLSGFTGNVGDPAANQKLFDGRAHNVMAELVKLGVNPDRIESQGYGQERSAAGKTELGRQLTSGISLQVTKK